MAMSCVTFLRGLFEEGRVRVPSHGPLSASDVAESDRELASFDAHYRLEFPAPPPLVIDAARWAAVAFLRACQFAVHRDLPGDLVTQVLTQPCPGKRGSGVDYSVDLVFRFLPDLFLFVRSAAEKDPQVECLRTWGRQWPLSSVGMADLGNLDVSSFIEDPGLLTVYVDRVLSRGDASRLQDERVRRAVEAAVGMHRELAGKLASTLATREETVA
jgi:hypothetical protein